MKKIAIAFAAAAAFASAFAEPAARVERTGTEYETVHAAVEAAQAGDTVTVLRDVVTTSPVRIARDLTLDLGGHVITSRPDSSDVWTVRIGDSGSPTVAIRNGRIVASEDDPTRERGGIRANATRLTLERLRLEVYGHTTVQVTGKAATLSLVDAHLFSVTVLDGYPCILMYEAGEALTVDAESTVVSDARQEGVIQSRGSVEISGLVSNSCPTARMAIYGCVGAKCTFSLRSGGCVVSCGGRAVWCGGNASSLVRVESGASVSSPGVALFGADGVSLEVEDGASVTSEDDACVDFAGASSRLVIGGGFFTAKAGVPAIRVAPGSTGFVSGGEFSGDAKGTAAMPQAYIASRDGRTGRWVRSMRRGYVRPRWKPRGRIPLVR